MKNRVSVAILVALLYSLFQVTLTRAHVETPRLEISAEYVNPGGVVDVRGVGFDYEESATLYFERAGIVVEVGNVAADVEGVFFHIIVLPVDLPPGVYNIHAVTDHHDVFSPALTVQGPAIIEGGGQGERDEDDGLLAPMPTYAPAVSSTPIPQVISAENLVEQRKPPAIVYSILLVAGIVALLGIRILKK